MHKVEYTDFYRFVTSLGLVLFTLAFLVPYLLYRDLSTWLVATPDGTAVPKAVADALVNRQSIVLCVCHHMSWFSPVLLICGICLTGWGATKWKARQERVDQKEDIELERIKQLPTTPASELAERALAAAVDDASATPEQEQPRMPQAEPITEQPAAVVGDAKGIGQSGTPPADISAEVPLATKYLAVENAVAGKLEMCLRDQYMVLRSRQLGDNNADIILVSTTQPARRDFIVEVAYTHGGYSIRRITTLAERMAAMAREYRRAFLRIAVPLVIIVGPAHIIEPGEERHRALILAQAGRLGADIRMICLPEEKIADLDCSDIAAMWSSL